MSAHPGNPDPRPDKPEGKDRSGRRPEADEGDMPAAGPHAKPHLTVPERTPGTGALPDPRRPRDGDSTG